MLCSFEDKSFFGDFRLTWGSRDLVIRLPLSDNFPRNTVICGLLRTYAKEKGTKMKLGTNKMHQVNVGLCAQQ